MKNQEERKENFINMRKRRILKLMGVAALCSSAFISTKCALDKGITPKALTQENEIKKGLKKSYDNADFLSVDFPSTYSTCIKKISFINTTTTTIQFFVNEIDYYNYQVNNITTFTLSNYYNNRQYDYFSLVFYNLNDYRLYGTALYYDYQPFNNSFTLVESVDLLNTYFGGPMEIAFQLPTTNNSNETIYKINNQTFNYLLSFEQFSQEIDTNLYGNFISSYANTYETNKRLAQELQQQVNSLTTQLHNLQSQYNNLQTQYSNLQTQYSDLQNDYNDLEIQFDNLDYQLSQKTIQYNQLFRDYQDLLETNQNLQEQIHELEQDSIQYQNRIDYLNGEIRRLNEQIDGLNEQIEILNGEIDGLGQVITDLNEQLALVSDGAISIMDWIKIFLHTCKSFLEMEIFPHVKIAYIVAFPILFGIVSLFIKLIRGA